MQPHWCGIVWYINGPRNKPKCKADKTFAAPCTYAQIFTESLFNVEKLLLPPELRFFYGADPVSDFEQNVPAALATDSSEISPQAAAPAPALHSSQIHMCSWSRSQSRYRRLIFAGAQSRQGILLCTDAGAVKNGTTTAPKEV